MRIILVYLPHRSRDIKIIRICTHTLFKLSKKVVGLVAKIFFKFLLLNFVWIIIEIINWICIENWRDKFFTRFLFKKSRRKIKIFRKILRIFVGWKKDFNKIFLSIQILKLKNREKTNKYFENIKTLVLINIWTEKSLGNYLNTQ